MPYSGKITKKTGKNYDEKCKQEQYDSYHKVHYSVRCDDIEDCYEEKKSKPINSSSYAQCIKKCEWEKNASLHIMITHHKITEFFLTQLKVRIENDPGMNRSRYQLYINCDIIGALKYKNVCLYNSKLFNLFLHLSVLYFNSNAQ